MTSIIAGNQLGLSNTSLNTLNLQNGDPATGRSGEGVYVNAATGNLIVQRQDEILMARGLDVGVLRTYNSQAQFDGDNNDNWRIGFYRQIKSLTGTVNTSGSTVVRVDADGAELTYSYDVASSKYINKDGAGSFDTLSYNGTSNQWTWTDSDSRVSETYDWNAGLGKLLNQSDAAGNTSSYTYIGTLLSRVQDASGESTYLDYTGNNLTQIRTVKADGTTSTRVHYSFDASNRLIAVMVDLSPDDNSITDGKTYVTSYTYDGTSKRIATLTQTDGTSLSFVYDTNGKVTRITDALNNQTNYSYDTTNRITTVTDALGLQTKYSYDTKGQLIKISAPAINGASITQSFAYNSNGDVTSTTDGEGNVVTMEYDGNGNLTLTRDALGNTITRTYNSNNQLLTETTYLVPDPDGAGSAQPTQPATTRYVYDPAGKSQLRFVIDAMGGVTEYRYNDFGQRTTSISLPGNLYAISGLATTAAPSEGEMTNWLNSISDKSNASRTDLTYDFRGQLSTSTVYWQLPSDGTPLVGGNTTYPRSTTTYVYDQGGNLLQIIEPAGGSTHTTTNTYDGMGRLLTTTNGLNQPTAYIIYDNAGNKTTQRMANGLYLVSSYDSAGRLVSILKQSYQVSPSDSMVITTLNSSYYFYDNDNRLRMTRDGNGINSWRIYDNAGRTVGDIDGNGSLTEYAYDNNSKLVQTIHYAKAANMSGLTLDANSKPTAAALALTLADLRPLATLADQKSWNAYDAAGRLVKTVAANGAVKSMQYDGDSRLTTVTEYANKINASMLPANPSAVSIMPLSDQANDRVTRHFYDAAGQLRATLDGEGYLTETLYNAIGQAWNTIAYGNPTSSTLRASGTLDQLRPLASASDIKTFTFYDGQGKVVGTVDGEGYLTAYLHDANSNPVLEWRYATALTSMAIGTINQGSSINSFLPIVNDGDQIFYSTYDALNRLQSTRNAEGRLTQYAYDSVGNLVSTIDSEVNAYDPAMAPVRTQSKRYDLLGRVTSELGGEGNAALAALGANPTPAQVNSIYANYGTSYVYDQGGRLINETDANGNRTCYYYNQDDQLVGTINALGEITGCAYNALNQKIATAQYGLRIPSSKLGSLTGGSDFTFTILLMDAAIVDVGSTVAYAYNIDGTLASATDAMGNKTDYQYNAFGEQTTVIEPYTGANTLVQNLTYDRRGLQVSTTTDPSGINATTTNRYDAFGRVTQTIDAKDNVRSASYDRRGRQVQTTVNALNGTSSTRSTTYDAFDQVLTQTDELGNVTRYAYNTALRSSTITTPEGISVKTAHDIFGQTVSVLDGMGNTTNYVYDLNGNLTQTHSPLSQTTTQEFDHANHLISSTDAKGISTTLTYDAANRVLTRTVDPTELDHDGLNLLTQYDYDAKGQQITVTDPMGSVTQMEFDLNGQVIRQTVDQGNGKLNLVTQYSFDAQGNQLSVTDAKGTLTQYTYDKLGRRIKEQIDPSGLNITTQYSFDKNDNVVSKTDGNGNVTRYVYDTQDQLIYTVDPTGAVTETRHDAAGQVVRTITYAQPISLANLAMNASAGDIQARLVPDSTQDHIQSQVFDKDGRLAYSIDPMGAVTRYTYDANGNLTQTRAFAAATSRAAWQSGTQVVVGSAANLNQAGSQVTLLDSMAGTQSTYYLDPVSGTYRGALSQSVAPSGYYSGGYSVAIQADGKALLGGYTTNANSLESAFALMRYNADGTPDTSFGSNGIVTTEFAVSVAGKSIALQPDGKILLAGNGPSGDFYVARYNSNGSLDGTFGDAGTKSLDLGANDNCSSIAIQTDGKILIGGGSEGSFALARCNSDGSFDTSFAEGGKSLTNFGGYNEGQSIALQDDGKILLAGFSGNSSTLVRYNSDGSVDTSFGYGGIAYGFGGANGAGAYSVTVLATGQILVSGSVDGNAAAMRFNSDGSIDTSFGSNGTVICNFGGLGSEGRSIAIQTNGKIVIGGAHYIDNYTCRFAVVRYNSDGSLDSSFGNGSGYVTTDVGISGHMDLGYSVAIQVDGTILVGGSSNGQFALVRYNSDGTLGRLGTLTYNSLNDQFVGSNNSLSASPSTLSRLSSPALAPLTKNVWDALYSDSNGNDQVTRNTYDAANRLIYSVDGIGAVTKYDYDANGNVVRKTAYANAISATTAADLVIADASRDQITRNFYDTDNRLSYSLDGVGAVTAYTYDANGNVTQKTAYVNKIAVDTEPSEVVADASRDQITRNVFDAANRLQYSVDGVGAVTAYIYDANGNVTQKTAYVNKIAVDAEPSEVVADASRDQITRNVYDAADRLSYTVDGVGAVTGYVYDAHGNVTQKTAYANPWTQNLALGRAATQSSDFTGGEGTGSISAFLAVDGNTNSHATTDASNSVTHTDYDQNAWWQVDLGSRQAISTIDLFNRADGVSDRLSKFYVFISDTDLTGRSYNDILNDINVRKIYTAGAAPLSLSLLAFTSGRYVRVQLAGQNYLSLAEVRVNSMVLQADVSRDRVTQYSYDAANRQIRTIYPRVGIYSVETTDILLNNGATGLADRSETSSILYTQAYYDTLGNIVANRDAAGNMRYQAYDAVGQLRYAVDAEGYVTGYVRDAQGNVTSLTRYADKIADASRAAWGTTAPSLATIAALLTNNSADRTIITQYDAMGRATQITEPSVYTSFDGINGSTLSPVIRHVYNAFGQVIQNMVLKIGGIWFDTTHYYDQRGLETATIDASGYITTQSYDAFGNVSERTEYANAATNVTINSYLAPIPNSNTDRTLRFSYDQNNRKLTETRVNVEYSTAPSIGTLQGIGTMRGDLTNSYVYDAFGNLIRTIDAGNNSVTTYYDQANRVKAVTQAARVIDGNSNFTGLTEFTRDVFGNVTQQVERANGASDITLNSYSTSSNSDDRVNTVVYDSWGRAIQTTDALDNAQYMSYDANGNLAKQWQGVSGIDSLTRTSFKVIKYDKLGQITNTIEPGSDSVQVIDTQMRYNAFGELIRKQSVFGVGDHSSAEYFEYDNGGHVWRTNSVDGVDKVMLYDLQGNLTAEIRSASTDLKTQSDASVANALVGTLRVINLYDGLGRMAAQKLANGATVHKTYDRWGNVLSISDARNANWKTEYSYNASNQVTKETKPTVHVLTNDLSAYANQRPITQHYYDYAGNQVAVRDARGNVNATSYDSAGNVLSELHADGGVIHHGYDAFSNEVKRTDAMNNLTQYAYNKLGQMITITRPSADFYQIVASSDDGPLNQDQALHEDRGPITLYDDMSFSGKASYFGEGTWDGLEKNFTSMVVKPGWAVTLYDDDYLLVDDKTYKARLDPYRDACLDSDLDNDVKKIKVWRTEGRIGRSSALTSAPNIITMTYDSLGRQLSKTDGSGSTQYTYDLRGNVIKVVQPGGVTTTDQYDAFNRKISETSVNGDKATWTYDYFGRITSREDIGGAIYSYTYDNLGRLTHETNTRGRDITTTYDIAGQVTQIVDKISAISTRTTSYSYDLAGHHTNEKVSIDGTVYSDQDLGYNSLGQLSRIGKVGADIYYYYDLVGNRVRITNYIDQDTTYFYAYDAMNRQILVDGNVDNNANNSANYNSSSGHRVAYDKNGNRISDAMQNRTDTYSYDALNRLYKTSRNNVTTRYVRFDQADRELDVYEDSLAAQTDMNTYTNIYDAAGRLVRQYFRSDSTIDGNNNIAWGNDSSTMFNTYDSVGNLTKSVRQLYGAGQFSTTSNYSYAKFDSYKQNQITSTRSDNLGDPGKTTLSYDVNGALISIVDEDKSENNRSFVNDVNGQVLQKTQQNNVLRNLVANGQVIGTYGTGVDQDKAPVVTKVKVVVTLHVQWQSDSGPTSEFRIHFKANEVDSDKQSIDDVADGDTITRTLSGVTWPPANGNLTVQVYGYEDDTGFWNSDDDLPTATRTIQTANWTKEGQEFGSFTVANDDARYYLTFKVYSDLSTTSYNDTVKNFSTYQILDAAHPGAGPGSYRVNAGDTLQSIAQGAYGDSALWYLIADANGLRGNTGLHTGQILNLPNTVGTVHNNASTFKPYNPANIVGDTSPYLNDSPGMSKCRQTGIIIAAVLAAVVIAVIAVLATVATLGAAGVPAMSAAGIAIAAIIGAVGGAVGSMASQGILVAGGLQDHVSWADVAAGAATGFLSAGLGAGAGAVAANIAKGASFAANIVKASVNCVRAAQGAAATARAAGLLASKVLITSASYAAQNVAADALAQGIKIAAGEQNSFNWKQTAAAALTGAFGGAGSSIGRTGSLSNLAGGILGNLAGSVSANYVLNEGQFDPTQFAADAVSVLGNAILLHAAFSRSAGHIGQICFVAGTLVHTNEGEKAIEQFVGGEMVLSRNETTGEIAYRRVVGTKVTPYQAVIRVVIRNKEGQSETLRTTSEHPFWIADKGWKPAAQLMIGDVLVNHEKQLLSVIEVQTDDGVETVYNIEVEEFHTYHVGRMGVWVHNDCTPELGTDTFIRDTHLEALKRFATNKSSTIILREAGKYTLKRLSQGAAAKGHDILEKSIKEKTITEAYKNHPVSEGWKEHLAGYVGHWDVDGNGKLTGLKGVYLVPKNDLKKKFTSDKAMLAKIEEAYKPENMVSIKDNKGNEHSIYKVNMERDLAKQMANVDPRMLFTGDYDLHDLIHVGGGGRGSVAAGSSEEKRLINQMNKAFGEVDENRANSLSGKIYEQLKFMKLFTTKYSLIQHGPQSNYVAEMRTNPHEKGEPMVGAVARSSANEGLLMVTHEGKVIKMNNQEEYISAFKKLNLTPKYTWNGELETGLKFVDLPKGRVKLAWADTASTGSKPPVPIFRNKVYPAPVAP